MNGDKLISVLIPAYNHEQYVQETIKSIIDQTYQNIELIIIDDGSKDSTWEKINELKSECDSKFVNVIFEKKQNEGTCKTLNRLLELASGEFVYFIASDDIAKPNAIHKELDFLIHNDDYLLAVGNNEIIDSNSKICFWDEHREIVYEIERAKYKTFADFLQSIAKFKLNTQYFGRYDKLYIANHIPNGYLIRRCIFEKTGKFTEDAPLEDYWLMLQLSKYGKMKYIDEVLFSYRWHATNSIKDIDRMHQYDIQTREYEDRLLEKLNTDGLLSEVIKCKENGVLYKTQGIPFIFQILSYKRQGKKLKIVKLFNFVVLEYQK